MDALLADLTARGLWDATDDPAPRDAREFADRYARYNPARALELSGDDLGGIYAYAVLLRRFAEMANMPESLSRLKPERDPDDARRIHLHFLDAGEPRRLTFADGGTYLSDEFLASALGYVASRSPLCLLMCEPAATPLRLLAFDRDLVGRLAPLGDAVRVFA